MQCFWVVAIYASAWSPGKSEQLARDRSQLASLHVSADGASAQGPLPLNVELRSAEMAPRAAIEVDQNGKAEPQRRPSSGSKQLSSLSETAPDGVSNMKVEPLLEVHVPSLQLLASGEREAVVSESSGTEGQSRLVVENAELAGEKSRLESGTSESTVESQDPAAGPQWSPLLLVGPSYATLLLMYGFGLLLRPAVEEKPVVVCDQGQVDTGLYNREAFFQRMSEANEWRRQYFRF